MMLEIHVQASLGQAQKGGGFKLVNGIPTLPFDNWIPMASGNTCINMRFKKLFPFKKKTILQ